MAEISSVSLQSVYIHTKIRLQQYISTPSGSNIKLFVCFFLSFVVYQAQDKQKKWMQIFTCIKEFKKAVFLTRVFHHTVQNQHSAAPETNESVDVIVVKILKHIFNTTAVLNRLLISKIILG